MKTSYKLYGTVWDGQHIPEKCPMVEISEQNVAGVVLKLSLEMNRENLEKVHMEENLILDVDFIPDINSVVIWDFYLLRLLQIAEYHQAKLACGLDAECCDKLNDSLKDFYKRKTPKRLLAQSVGAFQMIC